MEKEILMVGAKEQLKCEIMELTEEQKSALLAWIKEELLA